MEFKDLDPIYQDAFAIQAARNKSMKAAGVDGFIQKTTFVDKDGNTTATTAPDGRMALTLPGLAPQEVIRPISVGQKIRGLRALAGNYVKPSELRAHLTQLDPNREVTTKPKGIAQRIRSMAGLLRR